MIALDGVIFDKDGTLFDFAATWESWASTFLADLVSGDLDLAVEIGNAIGFNYLTSTFAKNSIVVAGTVDEIAAAAQPFIPTLGREEIKMRMNVAAAEAPQAEAVPLQPLLASLKSMKLRLGVATNDSEFPARKHLEQAGISDYFDFIAGFDSGFGGKPEPGQLLAFCAKLNMSANRVVMVGDSTHDLKAGRAAGMKTAAVLTGLAEAAELEELADVVLEDIGSLPAWIETLKTE